MLVETVLKSFCKQAELFERAAAYKGRPREQLVAIGEAEELCFRIYPHHYRALQTIRIASQLGNRHGRRDEPLQQCESTLLSLVVRIILDGVRAEDLKLRSPQGAEELAFTIWILAFGTRALMDTKVATTELGIKDGFRVARESTDILLDAMGWEPVSSEWDYAATREKIRREVFFAEWQQLESACATVCG